MKASDVDAPPRGLAARLPRGRDRRAGIHTRAAPREPAAAARPARSVAVDAAGAAERLAGALRRPTINWDDASRRDTAAFVSLHQHLDTAFPTVARTLTREIVAGYSLLYTWRGSQPDRPPIILTAHLDVVPAEPDPRRPWTHPPFAGVIDDGSVWGRGAIDDKSGVLGLLESVEALLASRFAPERTVYLAFGHNEEGADDASGARAIADLLASRGVRDAWLLDEGGLIYDRVPGVTGAVAFVGVAEKAAIDVEISVRGEGGHASMPPRETAVGLLARALDRIERRPMPARLDGATAQMFATLAPEMALPMRLAFANLWLMRPLVLRQLAARSDTNATIRTTFAPTMLAGSAKTNVLATDARAIVNVRLLPGDTPEQVLAHLRDAVDDPRVAIAAPRAAQVQATTVSATDTPEFAALQRAIRAVYPDVRVAPYLTTGATDARHYVHVAPNVYRFLPVRQDGALEAIHGIDEHIRIDAYVDAIRTYATIISTLSAR